MLIEAELRRSGRDRVQVNRQPLGVVAGIALAQGKGPAEVDGGGPTP